MRSIDLNTVTFHCNIVWMYLYFYIQRKYLLWIIWLPSDIVGLPKSTPQNNTITITNWFSVDKGVYWLQEAVITVKIYTFYILQMWLIDWWLDVKGWNWFWQECIIREGQEIPPWHRVQITQANWIQQNLIEGKKNGKETLKWKHEENSLLLVKRMSE